MISKKIKKKLITYIFLILFLLGVSNVFTVSVVGSVVVDYGSAATNNARSIVVDSNGDLHIIYGNDSKMYHENSSDGGVTWENRVCINDLYSGSYRNVVIDSDDVIWVFYRILDVYDKIKYNKSVDYGLTWTGGTVKTLSSNCHVEDVNACVDSADDIYVAWSANWKGVGPDDYWIGYSKYIAETSTWSTADEILNSETTEKTDICAVPLDNGSVFVSYVYWPFAGDDIYDLKYYIMNNNLDVYESGTIYGGASINYDVYTMSMLTNLNNDIDILYIRENGGVRGLYYKKYDTSERSFTDEETVYYDSSYPVLTCSISWTREGETIALFSKHNVWSSTDKIHKRTRSYNGEWTDTFMMNQGNNYECENPSLCYQRYPDTWIFTQGFIFTFFNDTNDTVCYAASNTNLWYNGSYYPGDNPWGGPGGPGFGNHITFNVYNESNTSEGLTFNIFVTNQSGSETYYDDICTNPYNVYYNLLPTGDKISFLIGSAGYYSRQFYMDINTSLNYEINVYLAPLSANLYFMIVIDEYNNQVEDVFLVVKRYMDHTGKYENMTSLYTDGAGQCSAYLLPGVQYKVFLNKTGYYDKTDDYIPDPNYYGIGYPKYFKIYRIYPPGPPVHDIYMDIMVLSAYNSSTMLIYYYNKNNDNDHVNFTVHDFFNNSAILAYYNISSYPNNISLYFIHANYNLSGDILKVVAVATRTNGTVYTIVKYFNINRRTGAGSAAIAAILSVGLCLFGLTLAHPKTVLGVVGIIVLIIAIAITAFADQSVWYIHLIQAIELILLIYVILVFREEGIHVV